MRFGHTHLPSKAVVVIRVSNAALFDLLLLVIVAVVVARTTSATKLRHSRQRCHQQIGRTRQELGRIAGCAVGQRQYRTEDDLETGYEFLENSDLRLQLLQRIRCWTGSCDRIGWLVCVCVFICACFCVFIRRIDYQQRFAEQLPSLKREKIVGNISGLRYLASVHRHRLDDCKVHTQKSVSILLYFGDKLRCERTVEGDTKNAQRSELHRAAAVGFLDGYSAMET